ncbi:MAG: hypothetical protein KAT71_07295 [Gammaproteobacteria bacterium]|nr:hypothetical protein [Gammaproteobacteria bacterium]
MPKTKDYKKIAEKLEKEVARLQTLIKASYQMGYEKAYTEIEKMDDLYEKHMIKAEKEFAKKIAKKPTKKKTAPKKIAAKKANSKKSATKKTVKK